MKKVGVVGVGYVGLTQAVGMAQLGHSVVAYDIDEDKINKLKESNSPFFEPGLEEALSENLTQKKISFSSQIECLKNVDFIFLCLPTPQDEDGSADTSHLISAVMTISAILKPETYLIIKSTVPLNSWKQVQLLVQNKNMFVVSNPEFLREGSALKDFHEPDRIVIGAESDKIAYAVSELYSSVKTEFVITNNTSAELIKYAANSFLAMKLSFVNDIAALCENLFANTSDVLHGVGLDRRIGNQFLTPGPGWGGSCFPKDVRALASIADKEKIMMPLLGAAIASNENAHQRVVQKIINKFGDLNGLKIGALGLSFKANTDDTRNSPAIEIIKKLQILGADVLAYDPAVRNVPGISTASNAHEVLQYGNLTLLLTEWDMFKEISPRDLKEVNKMHYIIDSRNILNKEAWIEKGFQFM
jgi:UDPglucose 6-dehydrogenase